MSQELLLSVLIPSIPSRFAMAQALVQKLEAQIGNEPVQLLLHLDNKKISIGQKRDQLNQAGIGGHLAQLDDDDDISSDYISRLLTAIRENPNVDVVTFVQRASINSREFTVRFGLGHENQQVDMSIQGALPDRNRVPFHCCAWRRTLAQKYHYPHIMWGEDFEFVKQLLTEAKSEIHIPHVIHYYRYNDSITEAK